MEERLFTLMEFFHIHTWAYRHSLKWGQRVAGPDDVRAVPFPSLHLSLLYVFAFKAGFATRRQRGAVSNPADKDKFKTIARGIAAWSKQVRVCP